MTSISAASANTYQSPLQQLQAELQSQVTSGAISSSDQDALSSALTDIDSQVRSSRDGDPSAGGKPGDIKPKIDDLISSEVSSGKLTSDQATELQGLFKAAFANDPGGAGGDASGAASPGGAGGLGGPGGAGGPAPGGPGGAGGARHGHHGGGSKSDDSSSTDSSKSSSSSSSGSSTSSASDLLQQFLQSLQDAASNSSSSGYGATGSTSSSSSNSSVSSLLIDYQS